MKCITKILANRARSQEVHGLAMKERLSTQDKMAAWGWSRHI